MRLGKVVQFAAVVTIVALIYIHMQMKIFSLAYQGKDKENEVTALSELTQKTYYDILELKSANHLGKHLLGEASSLRFSDHTNVVQLVTTESASDEGTVVLAEERQASHPLLSLFSLRPPQNAHAQETRGFSR